MSKLFSKFKIGSLELKNRIVMPPMCTYSAEKNNEVNDFHIAHYLARAIGNMGLIIVEATAVQKCGRISNKDLGIYDDRQIKSHENLTKNVKKFGSKIAIQLAHAGRKSSSDNELISVTDESFNKNYKKPKKMNIEDIENLKQDFINSAIRAQKAGYDIIEIHSAHGYLLNTFLSRKLNQRKDKYGKDRALLLKEIIKEIQKNVKIPIGVRLSAHSWQSDDYDLQDTLNLCKELEALNIDFLHISSGGLYENPDIMPTIKPLYQCEYAKIIKNSVKTPIIAVGMINNAPEAEALLLGEICDLVAFGRSSLANANIALKMAAELKETIISPYSRAFNS